MHPLRKSSPTAQVLDLHRASSSSRQDDEVGEAIASVTAIGEMIDELQAKVGDQERIIERLRAEVRDLTMHKEAAYSEMSKAETALRSERERADHSEQLCQQAIKNEREAQEKVQRLIISVRDTFCRVERADAA